MMNTNIGFLETLQNSMRNKTGACLEIGAVLGDLYLMQDLQVPCIFVDDFTRETEESQVPMAVREFVEKSNYTLVGTGPNPLGQGRVVGLLILEGP